MVAQAIERTDRRRRPRRRVSTIESLSPIRWLSPLAASLGKFLPSNRPTKSPAAKSPASKAQARSSSRLQSRIADALKPTETVDRLAILQAVWGEGCLFPGGPDQVLDLVKPFGIDSSMSLLDLSAGLGLPSRRVATTFDVYITGLERNPEAAERGHKQSVAIGLGKQFPISTYDPERVVLKPRAFSGAYGQLLLSTVRDKERFLEELRKSLRPYGQLTFRDFVRGPNPDHGAIERLNRLEPYPLEPWSLQEMNAGLRAANLNARVAEDVSDAIERQSLAGWREFVELNPIPASRRAALGVVVDEAELWYRRIAALRSGALRFYRFYATVPPQEL